jgi:hypothetical protein
MPSEVACGVGLLDMMTSMTLVWLPCLSHTLRTCTIVRCRVARLSSLVHLTPCFMPQWGYNALVPTTVHGVRIRWETLPSYIHEHPSDVSGYEDLGCKCIVPVPSHMRVCVIREGPRCTSHSCPSSCRQQPSLLAPHLGMDFASLYPLDPTCVG